MPQKNEINVSFKLTGKGIEAFNNVLASMKEKLPGVEFNHADVGRQSIFMAADSVPSVMDISELTDGNEVSGD